MLTISELAKLAGTTRRTLIFYDQKELFKPVKINTNGYRYYDYNQLYNLTFILSLHRLGLSVDDIKLLQTNTNQPTIDVQLNKLLKKIQNQIDNLNQAKHILLKRAQTAPQQTYKIKQPIILNYYEKYSRIVKSSATLAKLHL